MTRADRWDDISPRAISPTRIVLNRLPVGVQHRISPALGSTLTLAVRQAIENEIPGMVAELTGYVLAEQLPPETVSDSYRLHDVRYAEWPAPATWRDHWKLTYGHRWWARWLVRHRPARIIWRRQRMVYNRTVTMSVNLSRYRTYPHTQVTLDPDRYGPPVLASTVTTPAWTWR
jgi:hypothetical protein